MSYFYAYAILCIGCYASYQGVPAPLSIIATTMLLTLPSIKMGGHSMLKVEAIAHTTTSLVFALIAHVVGRGIAFILGT
jgi:hypothetical protein